MSDLSRTCNHTILLFFWRCWLQTTHRKQNPFASPGAPNPGVVNTWLSAFYCLKLVTMYVFQVSWPVKQVPYIDRRFQRRDIIIISASLFDANDT